MLFSSFKKLSFTTLMLLFLTLVKAQEPSILIKAVSNNAVALAENQNGLQLFSFNGLTKGKGVKDVSNIAMGFDVKTKQSYLINSMPYQKGRLASVAVTVKNRIYLFGGYSVSDKHEEISTPEVFQFNPQTLTFELFSSIPLPVDDSVALVYQDRYIYLISGWHNDANVNDVQVLDTETKRWFKASPFPGYAVFGHAAGIIDNQMVIVDGVKVASVVKGKRQYQMSPESYIGIIDPQDFTLITWRKLPQHPGKAMYRMAATGVQGTQTIIFAAGSANPYNYNGIGYNGVPSKPSNKVFAWELKSSVWLELPPLQIASMDHRALLHAKNELFILGGMVADQQVSSMIQSYQLKNVK
jgi:hypothetical protein